MNPFVADPEWGIWIILYFYLGGMASGAYFLATLVALFGHEEDSVVSRVGYRLALPLIMICGVLLIVDLERPDRFWHMMFQSEVVSSALEQGWPLGGWETMLYAINLKHWSPMSIGAWALALFGLCATLSFVGTLWSEGRLNRLLAHGIVGRTLQVVGSVVGFFVGSYTGVLLSASNQPLWSATDWVGPLFLASSASTGIAAVLLVLHVGRGASATTLERLEHANLWSLTLELGVFLIFLASLLTILPSLERLLPMVLETRPGRVLVIGTLVMALLVPLVLHLLPGQQAWAAIAASVCVLVGGYALRFGMLETAPALLEASHEPPRTPVWLGTALAVALPVATVILIFAVRWLLAKEWAMTVAQHLTVTLGAALVCAVVIFYAFGWEVGLPEGRLPGFSPEQDRERGGDVGASALNRPDPPEAPLKMRSKIFGWVHER